MPNALHAVHPKLGQKYHSSGVHHHSLPRESPMYFLVLAERIYPVQYPVLGSIHRSHRPRDLHLLEPRHEVQRRGIPVEVSVALSRAFVEEHDALLGSAPLDLKVGREDVERLQSGGDGVAAVRFVVPRSGRDFHHGGDRSSGFLLTNDGIVLSPVELVQEFLPEFVCDVGDAPRDDGVVHGSVGYEFACFVVPVSVYHGGIARRLGQPAPLGVLPSTSSGGIIISSG
mmetsp:Transcript_25431/g.54941  ORF Transcript_25431/g.54941 Transcript_25431/m.54941 type:complete len:228 (-) Transcript_25431:1158-1841(-)